MLTKHTIKTYEDILVDELASAMGCTEPIAIAYAASILREALGEEPTEIYAALSGNIIKNVKSVIVPSTGGMHGIEAAVAAGIIAAEPKRKLEVLSALPENARELITSFQERCKISVTKLNTSCSFDLILSGIGKSGDALVHIKGSHTNIVEVCSHKENITNRYLTSTTTEENRNIDRSSLTVENIFNFANDADLTRLTPYLKKQIELNYAISKEGLSGNWGASIGKVMLSMGGDISRRASAYAAAGSDARMSGCEMPVCIISGSGNQGITASVPVIVYAEEIKATEEQLLRALIVSDLITVHQKNGIGTLSAYCGAISAGVGAAAGICYLLGGDYYLISHTIVNAVAILSGTICDGAKPSCAAKIAMAVEAGIMGYEMAKAGKQFYGGDGIVTKGVENTIKNIGKLAKDGMLETDKEIIGIMLGEKQRNEKTR